MPQVQGAQILRNEAYLLYAGVTKDAAQHRSWTFCEAVANEIGMTIFKKTTCTILVAVLSIMLCACGPKKDAVVFSVGGAPYELGFWEKLIRDFEKESGISVELLRQPTDTDQRRQNRSA